MASKPCSVSRGCLATTESCSGQAPFGWQVSVPQTETFWQDGEGEAVSRVDETAVPFQAREEGFPPPAPGPSSPGHSKPSAQQLFPPLSPIPAAFQASVAPRSPPALALLPGQHPQNSSQSSPCFPHHSLCEALLLDSSLFHLPRLTPQLRGPLAVSANQLLPPSLPPNAHTAAAPCQPRHQR